MLSFREAQWTSFRTKGTSMRRFNFRSIQHAKNMAKTLKAELSHHGHEFALSKSYELIALILGYGSWHDMANSPRGDDGPFDDELSLSEAAERRLSAVRHLRLHGIPHPVAELVLDSLRLTQRAARLPEDFTIEHVTEDFSAEPYEVPVLAKRTIALGLELIETDDDDYISASMIWLDRLPPVFRPQIDRSQGMNFLWREGGRIFPICFPDVFTADEVSSARNWLRAEHPETFRVFNLGSKASPAEIERAGRGFATDRIDYGFQDILSEEENGEVIILAGVVMRFGPEPKDDLDHGALYMFRVPAADLDGWEPLRIDRDSHVCLGKYEPTADGAA